MVRFSLSKLLVLASGAWYAVEAVAVCSGPPVNGATLRLVEQFEGFEPRPKPDPIGLPTVGFGHKCQQKGCSEVPYRFPLSRPDAEALLASDLKVAEACIATATASSVHLNDNQYGALVSWAFNVGCGNARGSSLVRRLNAGQSPGPVIAEELPLWNKGGGRVLPGLVRRRAAEVRLAQTPSNVPALPAGC